MNNHKFTESELKTLRKKSFGERFVVMQERREKIVLKERAERKK